MTRRTDQINDLLRAELSDLLREEVNDPRVHGLVTITRVDVSPDLRQARAYVSVLGSDDDRRSTMEALESARPFLRRELGTRVKLRYTPNLRFVSDTSMEEAQEMTDLMRQTAAERGETLPAPTKDG
ncbi:MAG TPA: 30S ribosome-binding factor RbfA [Dehalococcoidia bacterium]|nr:30S ribosome-binding factor RbfA [Dehalococcoidia bacterium]